MSSVDERIVEMKFENHLFEKNVDTSIHSLEKLKTALNFEEATSGLEGIDKSINQLNFDKVADGVEALNERFSTMGIVGMTVIQNLTNAAMDLGATLLGLVARPVSSAINQVISGGWSRATNIDQAKFKIEGLHKKWEDVYPDIDYGVNQTAYGLDAAASVAAQLIASGVEFGETFGPTGNSPMAHALRGISGVAAMTNSTYEEIGHVFTTIAGQGRVMAVNLNSLATRGLNAAATLGDVLGHTEAEIKEMVSDGEISFQQFADAMNEAYGEQAVKANSTLEGALSNMKSALSRIGQPVAEKYRATMVGVYNSLRLLFVGIKKELEGSGIYESLGTFVTTVGSIFSGLVDSVNTGPIGWIAKQISHIFDAVNGFLSPIADAIKKASDAAKGVADSAKEIFDLDKHIEEMANKVIRGDYKNGDERVKALAEANEYYELIQNKVNEILDCSFRYEISEEKINEYYKEGKKTIGATARDLRNYVEYASEIDERLSKPLTKTKAIEALSYAIAGIKSAGSVIGNTVKAIGSGAFKGLAPLFTRIGNAMANAGINFGAWFNGLDKYLKDTGYYDKAQTKFANAFEKVSNALNRLWTILSNIGGKIATGFGQIKKQIKSFNDAFKETEGYRRIQNFKNSLIELKDKAIDRVNKAIDSFLGKEVKLPELDTKALAESLSKVIVWITDKAKELKDAIVSMFTFDGGEGEEGEGKGLLGGIFEKINSWFAPEDERILSISKITTWIKNTASKIGTASKDGAEDIAEGFEEGKGFGGVIHNAFDKLIAGLTEKVQSFDGVIDLLLSIFERVRKVRWGMFFMNIPTFLNALMGLAKWPLKAVKYASLTIKGVKKELYASAREHNANALLSLAKAIGVLAVSLLLLSQLSWGQLFKAAVGLGLITAALVILLKSLSKFAPSRTMLGPVDQITFTLNSIRLSFISFARELGKAATIASFGIAMGILTATFIKLTGVPWQQAVVAAGILGMLIAELVASIVILSKFTKTEKLSFSLAAMLLAIAAAVSIVAKAIIPLAKLSWVELGKGLLGIAGIMAGIGALMYASKFTKKARVSVLLTTMLLIVELVAALVVISMLPLGAVIKATAALVLVLGSVALVMFAVSKIPSTGKVAGAIFGIGLLIGEIALILSALTSSQFDPDALLKVSESLSLLLGVSAVVFALLSKFASGPALTTLKTSFFGSLGIDIILGVVGGFLSGVGALLSLLPDNKYNKLIEGMERLNRLAEKIGEFFGSLVGGFINAAIIEPLEGFILDLPELGEKLKAFGNSLSEGFTGDFDIDSFQQLTEVFAVLVEIGDKNTIADIRAKAFSGDNSLTLLGKDLNEFALQMQDYGKKVDGLPTKLISRTSRAISSVMKYADIADDIDTVKNVFTGDSNIVALAKELQSFAEEMKLYSEKAEGIKVDNLNKTTPSINALVAVASAAPSLHTGEGFWDELINGDNRLSTLGATLVPFAAGLVAYSWIVGGLKSGAVEKSEDAANIIIALAKEVPSIKTKDSIVGYFTGFNDFEALSSGLAGFGQAMVDYSKAVEPLVGSNAIEATQELVGIVQDLQKANPNIHDENTLLGLLIGDNSLETLGENLTTFGTNLVSYNDIVDGIDFSPAINATGQIRSLLHLFSKIENANTGIDSAGALLLNVFEWIQTVFSDVSLSLISDDTVNLLEEVGKTLAQHIISGFTEGTAGINDVNGKYNIVNDLIRALLKNSLSDEEISKSGALFAENLINAWTDSLNEKPEALKESLQTILDNTIKQLDNYRKDVDEHANDTINEVGDIIGTDTSLAGKVRSLCSGMISAVDEYLINFTNIGLNIVTAIANGINAGTYKVTSAINAAAGKAIEEANKKLDINSPSKVFIAIGGSIMEGLGKGIDKFTHYGTDAMADAVHAVTGSMSDAMTTAYTTSVEQSKGLFSNLRSASSYINSVINSSLDTRPTITPVVDLSNIQNGMNGINNLFGNSTFALNGLSYAQTNFPNSYEYGAEKVTKNTEAGILSQIRGIRSDLMYLGESITNMQMVLDSGVLVGSIGGGVDQRLGTIQKLKERWA